VDQILKSLRIPINITRRVFRHSLLNPILDQQEPIRQLTPTTVINDYT